MRKTLIITLIFINLLIVSGNESTVFALDCGVTCGSGDTCVNNLIPSGSATCSGTVCNCTATTGCTNWGNPRECPVGNSGSTCYTSKYCTDLDKRYLYQIIPCTCRSNEPTETPDDPDPSNSPDPTGDLDVPIILNCETCSDLPDQLNCRIKWYDEDEKCDDNFDNHQVLDCSPTSGCSEEPRNCSKCSNLPGREHCLVTWTDDGCDNNYYNNRYIDCGNSSGCPVLSPTPTGLPDSDCDKFCFHNDHCSSGQCIGGYNVGNYVVGGRCSCPGISPTVTPPGGGPTATVTPIPPTGDPNCNCTSNLCSGCVYPLLYTPDFEYTNPPRCSFSLDFYSTPPSPENKQSWCQASKKTLGDADGNNSVDMIDYSYWLAVINGAKINPIANPDFNGNGVVDNIDRAIIQKTLNQ